ncbi:nitroreductase [Nocardioides deserti]|uniref:Nitroreductase n=1 Tax=Nocardioides deserti TaxID=1588644 RepID=A0ABR6U8B1_9ACTN|nr:nitroreductase [Nocardioides deserti]MBC2960086.1 nitroreductase [Nocardioides deserti]GGO74972.1 nitroreductase [Nocardioides deserti]
MDLADVLSTRHSCRAFRSDEVDADILDRLFTLAQHTPSWCNTQPWHVHLVSGPAITRFSTELTDHVLSGSRRADLGMPAGYFGVYAERRRESGHALYEAVGVARDDKPARRAQALLNYTFFGAPHVAVITTDRDQGTYGAIDCGGYVATLTNTATALGLGSVAQAAIAMCSDKVREFLDLPEDRLVVCAVSLGYPDLEHPVNGFRTSRARIEDVVTHVRD